MNNDLISREALKEQIKTEIANVPKPDTDTDYYVGVEQGLKLAKVIIDNAPPVPNRTQGEWIFDGWGTYCSECGYRPKIGGGKFCSECGAQMNCNDK